MTYCAGSSEGYSSESSAPTSAAPLPVASHLAVWPASGLGVSFASDCSCTVQPWVPLGQSAVKVVGAVVVAAGVVAGATAVGAAPAVVGVAVACATGVDGWSSSLARTISAPMI